MLWAKQEHEVLRHAIDSLRGLPEEDLQIRHRADRMNIQVAVKSGIARLHEVRA
jgi:hypothetical protein